MCEKEMELDALREKLAKVSKERDSFYEYWRASSEEVEKLWTKRNFWRWMFIAACGVNAVSLLLWALS